MTAGLAATASLAVENDASRCCRKSRASITVRPPVPDGVLLGYVYFSRFE